MQISLQLPIELDRWVLRRWRLYSSVAGRELGSVFSKKFTLLYLVAHQLTNYPVTAGLPQNVRR